MLIPLVFFKISTLLWPIVYLRSISLTISPVNPSRTIKSGEIEYPFPTEEIPIDLNEFWAFIFNMSGDFAVGLIERSDGYSNPISSIVIFVIFATFSDCICNIAPVPISLSIIGFSGIDFRFFPGYFTAIESIGPYAVEEFVAYDIVALFSLYDKISGFIWEIKVNVSVDIPISFFSPL